MRRLDWLPLIPVCLVLSCISRPGRPVRPDGFSLNVNDVSGLNEPWPLLGSLPFPRGVLRDPSAVRILSGGREVPCQIDVAATWPDGSIRWALAGFTAPPGGTYRVEFGEGVRRGKHPQPLEVIPNASGGFAVDTGVALYEFQADKLLPEMGWLKQDGQRIPVLRESGDGAYLKDNSGRMARVAGAAAEIENRFLKQGPARVVVKRSGWYVTADRQRVARAEVWFYFAQGSPHIRMTHSLVLTEDTAVVWVNDYGLEFSTPGAPTRVLHALGEAENREIRQIATGGQETFLLQDTYPHFVEREYRALTGRCAGGRVELIEEFPVAGDWAHGDYDGHGLTIVMPWLAERFPKEIAFGPGAARAVLWSNRSGRELDFRVATLVEEYWQSWLTNIRSPVPREVLDRPSNAQGAARTHDLWLLPTVGTVTEEAVTTSAIAAARPPLTLADTAWLCETEAMGYPMLHKDPDRFPEEEALISEYWDRFMLPLQAFPMTGFIAWGCYSSRSYTEAGGRPLAALNTLESLREYGVRREPWRHYARSGERRYFDIGHRFSRFTGDWYLAHEDVPGSPGKERGGFVKGAVFSGPFPRLPLFWADSTHRYVMNSGDIGHWLLEYYLTGDERSFELLHMIRESFEQGKWQVGGTSILALRTLLTLSLMDEDQEAGAKAKELVAEMVDLDSPNGFNLFEPGYGSMYKDHRTSHTILEYYLETGDPLAREAFLKLIDHRYRFDRRYNAAAGHKNFDAFTHPLAYRMTGDERYRRVVEQTVHNALYYSRQYPLGEQRQRRPEDPLEWPNLWDTPPLPGPRSSLALLHHEYHSVFIGFPTALKLLAEHGRSGRLTPLVVKSMNTNSARALFTHTRGRDTRISLFFSTIRPDVRPEVFAYPERPGNAAIPGVRIEIEKRRQWAERLVLRPDDMYHAFVTVPAEVSDGLYLLSTGGDEPFTVLDATTQRIALYCPDGFWSPSTTPIRRSGEGDFGRSGEGLPMFFKVPDRLDKLEVFLGRPARVRRPDGSLAVELSDQNIGTQVIPVEGRGGVWSIEPHFHGFKGTCPPVFYRLLNVEPIVAYGTADHLPTMTSGLWERRFPAPVEPPGNPATHPRTLSSESEHGTRNLVHCRSREMLEFVEGIAGRAVRLSGGRTLQFAAGEAHARGGCAYFPGNTGTVEFWFKADHSTHERPTPMTAAVDLAFVRAPQLQCVHRYTVSGSSRMVSSVLRLELLTSPGVASSAGYQMAHFFKAGEWTHVACTWDLSGGEQTEGTMNVFVNGRQWFRGAPHTLPRVPILAPCGPEDRIELGPFDGTMDLLRFSDTIRYEQDFIPAKAAPQVDGQTRALFLFDGNLRGASAYSATPIEAK